MNKQGDIASIIFVVIFLFIIAVIFFFVSHINNEIMLELDSTLNDTGRNTTETVDVINSFIRVNNSVWDYAFLGIFLGSLIAIGLSAYAIRISPVFYWIYGILSLVVLALGAMLSNIWQDMVADSTFTTTLTRFPITNSLLGTYYPLIVTGVIIIAMVIIFGKPPSSQEGTY